VCSVIVIAIVLALSSCASRELKAPCGPLAYADEDGCGPLKPVNSTPFASVLEQQP
jgi:hypothetical protein